ncbi:helix-turn-helix domain-containing protein [Mesorhizobium sp. ISC15]|uniref:helix-turn-helix domain-containing protein n=1 Tax=Mesorhizobium sp. ISC15 TaxID=3076429 RepID=UPI00301BD367
MFSTTEIPHPERIAYTIRQATEATGLSTSFIYKLLKDGVLARRKVGKRTFLLRADLEEFFRTRPTGKWNPGDTSGRGRAATRPVSSSQSRLAKGRRA